MQTKKKGEKFSTLRLDKFLVQKDKLDQQVQLLQGIDIDQNEKYKSIEEEEEKNGYLYNQLVEEKKLERLAIFDKHVIVDIKHSVDGFVNQDRKRGPKAKISIIDSIVMVIMW